MDLSYATIPNSDRAMVRIYHEPFYDGHLERYEEGVKNSYGQVELFPDGVFMVMDGGNSSPRSEDTTESICRSFREPDSSEEERDLQSFI